MMLARTCRLGLLCVLSVGLLRGARAQQMTKDITYTTDAAGTQRADLYEPAGAGPFAAIVYVHGGSWRSGNKDSFRKLATDLAAQGYVGFSIDYDLQPHSWPVSLAETYAAVRFVRAHAAQYHVDPARIVIAGTSAGGELAALVALQQKPDAPVAAAVILNGVFDLSSDASVITRYLGGTCESNVAACAAASPMQQIHAGAVPFFIGHGTADRTVGFGEAQAFTAALRQNGVAVTTYDATDGPHMYWEKKQYYAANLAAMKSFLDAAVSAGKGAQ